MRLDAVITRRSRLIALARCVSGWWCLAISAKRGISTLIRLALHVAQPRDGRPR